ncbi:MAG TPA: peptidylprolyl isomerase, partial [Candidatus Methylomirabilis sp.]
MIRWKRCTIFGERGSGPAGAGRSLRVVFLLAVFLGTFWTVEGVGAGQSGTPKTPAIRLLVVPTQIQARDAIIQATSGVPFDQIVREQSTGPERARGGYLGRVDPATLSPSVRAALAKTRVGRLSPAFETEGGFGVLQVLTDREEREAEARLLRKPEALDLLGKGIDLGKQGDVEGAVKLLAQ